MTDEPLPLEGSAFQKKVKADKNKLVIYLAGEITREFGPPPIITGERLEDFNQILYGVIEDKCPTLHLEKMHVWDIATSIFFGRRIDLVTRYILNRKIGEVLAVQKQRRALQAEQAQTKKADDNSLAEIRGAPELTETQKRDYELKMAIEDTPEDVKMLMDRAEVEAAQAEAFEKAMPLLTDLDDMKSRNFFRRNISTEAWLTRRPLLVPAITAVSIRADNRTRKVYENDWNHEMAAAEKQGQEAQTQGQASPAETLKVLPQAEAVNTPTAPIVDETAEAPPSSTGNALNTPGTDKSGTAAPKPTDTAVTP